MSLYMQWFLVNQITAAGYADGETTSDGRKTEVPGNLAVEIEGNHGVGAIFEGTKSELLRFATDIIEATLIAEARTKDRAARLAALADAETRVAELAAQPARLTLTPEQAAAFKAGQAGWDLAGNTDVEAGARLRLEALTGNGKAGKYTYAELEAMPMTDYLEACADILGTTDEPA